MKTLNLVTIYSIIGLLSFACDKSDEISPKETPSETNTGGTTDGGTETLSVQERLNNEDTSFEIYTSDNSLLDSLYGKTYQGGLIAYIDTANGSGFIASPEDIEPKLTTWGCASTVLLEQIVIFFDPINGRPIYDYLPVATGENIGSGETNTETIVAKCIISAATFCDSYSIEGYDDWYMPSKDEMTEVSKNLAGLDTLVSTYWTSTQEDITVNAKVHVISTADHTSSLHSKTSIDGLGLRAIRNF